MTLHTLALYAAFAVTLATGAFAAHTQDPASEKPAVAASASLPLSWVPDWFVAPLSRMLPEVPDPRERPDG